jgi:hypothetical protein
MKNEADLVRKIIKAVRGFYPSAYVTKLSDKFHRGLPDILICGSGRVLFVEVKDGSGVLSQVQRAEHLKIRKSGCDVIVVRGVEAVLDRLEKLTYEI